MGLLTDPSAGQGKLIKTLIKYHTKLNVLLYTGALIWFFLLAHNSCNMATYFSENALLPGLVKSEFNEANVIKMYYYELMEEMKTYHNSLPYSWLLAKFRQIGLDTYAHNFTLNSPLGKREKFKGKNVYGIMRAPRAASIESIVLSVPYRPPSNVHPTTAPGIAVMLAFAKFANRERYWAKDIIFLVTEHEQLGVQAWLEAYHSTSCGSKQILDHGDLRGRAGAIQAAINLELHDINLARIDVKIEGLNGHLPNLDLFSLVNRMCAKEGVQTTFKNRPTYHTDNEYQDWKYSFQTMMAMILTQCTGVPNGNHGLFHRFGIEALTMEGFSRTRDRGHVVDLFTVGRILEGVFRSLNNLLERLHQSYFFYLLPSSDRFVSIGYYIPVIVAIAGTLFIKSCANWHQLHSSNDNKKDKQPESKEKKQKPKQQFDLNIVRVSVIVLLTHAIGVFVMNSPMYLTQIGLHYGYATDFSTYFGFGFICIILLLLPLFIPGLSTEENMRVLSIVTNLEMGTVLIAISMMNFSLSLFLGILYVPLLHIISPQNNKFRSYLQRIVWLLLHPFIVMTLITLVSTYITFPNENVQTLIHRALGASQQALMFSIVDSYIYGNWLYKVVVVILLPIWLNSWFVLFPNYSTEPNRLSKININKKVQ